MTMSLMVTMFLVVSALASIVGASLALRGSRRVKAAQSALMAEKEQIEGQKQKFLAEEKKRHEKQSALHELWEEVNNLLTALYEQELSQQWIFDVELNALARNLLWCGSWIENDSLFQEQTKYCQGWIDELWVRFRHWEREETKQRLLKACSDLRERHALIGKCYCLSRISSAYLHFPGSLHVVETMLEEELVPAKGIAPYVESLETQLNILLSAFVQGKF